MFRHLVGGSRSVRFLFTGWAFALLFASSAHAGVQASGSNSILPSDSQLSVDEVITLDVRVTNTSTNTVPPNVDPVPATLTGITTAKLACTSSTCATELPGVLAFQSCTVVAAGVATCVLDLAGDPTGNTGKITMPAGGGESAAWGAGSTGKPAALHRQE